MFSICVLPGSSSSKSLLQRGLRSPPCSDLPRCPEASGLEVGGMSVPEHSHPLPACLSDPEQPHPVPWSPPLLLSEDGGQPASPVLNVAKNAHQNMVQESLFSALLTVGAHPVAYSSADSTPLFKDYLGFETKAAAVFANSLACF